MRILMILCFIGVECLYIPDSHPEEVQHATCKVATQEIEATANATITRQLKGVCSAREMNAKLQQLEAKFISEFTILKEMLHDLGIKIPKTQTVSPPLYDDSYYEDYGYGEEVINKEQSFMRKSGGHLNATTLIQTPDVIQIPEVIEIPEGIHISKGIRIPEDSSKSPAGPGYKDPILIPPLKPDFEFASTNLPIIIVEPSPQTEIDQLKSEILQYNSTVQQRELGNVFYYYWRAEGVQNLLQNCLKSLSSEEANKEIKIFSPHFTIDEGVDEENIRIQFAWESQDFEYVTLKLITAKIFRKKHRFTIFNQSDRSKDITSPMLTELKVNGNLYKISCGKLQSSFSDNNILIKLIVYLNS